MTSVTMDRPRTIRAFFDGSARISLRTIPEYMQVLVDRAPVSTPADVDWAQGVPKLLGGVSPQRDDSGGLWVFDSWDNGLPKGQNVTFTPVVGKNDQQILTARFVRAATRRDQSDAASHETSHTVQTTAMQSPGWPIQPDSNICRKMFIPW